MNTTIKGLIKKIDGTPISNAVVRLTLSNTSYSGIEAYLQSSSVEAITASNGTFSLILVANSSLSIRAPYTLEIFDGPVRLESREVYIPEVEQITLEDIAVYSKHLMFKNPDDKLQGVYLTEDETTASFEFLGAMVSTEDVSISINGTRYILPTYLINGGQG